MEFQHMELPSDQTRPQYWAPGCLSMVSISMGSIVLCDVNFVRFIRIEGPANIATTILVPRGLLINIHLEGTLC